MTKTPAAVVLSGYDSDLYKDLLTGWHTRAFSATAMTGEPRKEVVWMNYEPDDVLFGGVA